MSKVPDANIDKRRWGERKENDRVVEKGREGKNEIPELRQDLIIWILSYLTTFTPNPYGALSFHFRNKNFVLLILIPSRLKPCGRNYMANKT
jgi:hypothetical protein